MNVQCMGPLRWWPIGVAVAALGFLTACQPTPEPTPTVIPTIPPTATPSPLGFPGNPVTRNADWEPTIQEFDGIRMALVPAGCFMMGFEEDIAGQIPIHEVCFEEPFWIDVYEVTNEQYGSAGRWEGDGFPRETVSWFEARDHCESRGARLPTEAEWEYAARGPDGLLYPWGDEFVPENLTFADNSRGRTDRVGIRVRGVSWVGTYDMRGNVCEWVASWHADDDYYESLPDPAVNPQGPDSGSDRLARGGSWDNNYVAILGAAAFANRSWAPPDTTTFLYGFRCARSYDSP